MLQLATFLLGTVVQLVKGTLQLAPLQPFLQMHAYKMSSSSESTHCPSL